MTITDEHVWLAAEELFREQCPCRGPLIRAPRVVRGRFVRCALRIVSALTDHDSIAGDRALKQAAVDYAAHKAWTRVDPGRFRVVEK